MTDAFPTPSPDHAATPAWRRFGQVFTLTALVFTAFLYATVLLLDPFGIFTARGARPGPIMDLNQRFMYPRIVRSGMFDAAVIGTSTVRLLDPPQLDGLFGGRFANLAMNAATPWEQMQIADLFLREVPAPTTLIIGIDATWCEADADEKRLTFRAFPPWLYDTDRWNDYVELLNLKTVEIAARVAAYRLGLMDERIRGDGFEVFVPPDGTYDLARAQWHIWNGPPRVIAAAEPPVAAGEAIRGTWRFPALAWLDALLARLPATTRVVLVFPPVHIAAQPQPGSLNAARESECKARIAAIANRRGAAAADFAFSSAVTREDANYWDALHFRIGIANRFAENLRKATHGTSEGGEGFFRVLNRTPANRD